MPELFDLDTAFESLSREVAERTHPRGAGDAIGASRKRRTALGASAAVALIAIGGAAFGLTGDSDTLSPAGESQLPSPALLDAAAMTAATDGWVGAWRAVGEGDWASIDNLDPQPDCLTEGNRPGTGGPAELAEPSELGGRLLLTGTGEASSAYYADFATPAVAEQARAEILGSFEGCGAPLATLAFGEGTVRYYEFRADGGATNTWLATLDNRIALLSVNQATVAPGDGVVESVASALLAGLQEQASFTLDPALDIHGEFSESSSGYSTGYQNTDASPSAQPARDGILEQDFAAALAGWSDWKASGDSSAPTLRCVAATWTESTSGSGLSLGATAEQNWAEFEGPEAAQLGVSEFLSHLRECNSAQWTIDSSTVPGAVVAWYPGGTVWITSAGPSIALLQLPGGSEPPAEVAKAVGKLLSETLQQD